MEVAYYFTPAQIAEAKKLLDRECELCCGLSMGDARELLRDTWPELCPTYSAAFDLAEAAVRLQPPVDAH